MREILFRGKNTDSGEWVEGYLVQTQSHIYIIQPGWYNDDLFISLYNIIDEVDPETVGQFTGLTDENGKKIFEGDILYVHDRLLKCTAPFHEFRGVVEHKNGSFVIVGDLMTHYRWIDYDITVLGNIHDNPELLEATT